MIVYIYSLDILFKYIVSTIICTHSKTEILAADYKHCPIVIMFHENTSIVYKTEKHCCTPGSRSINAFSQPVVAPGVV